MHRFVQKSLVQHGSFIPVAFLHKDKTSFKEDRNLYWFGAYIVVKRINSEGKSIEIIGNALCTSRFKPFFVRHIM